MDDIHDICSRLPRSVCEDLLEGAGIACYDTESTADLRAAVASNVEDGTISAEDLEDLAGVL